MYAGLRDLETRGQLEEETRGLPVIPIPLDVTKSAERDTAVAQILAEQGRIDALVNNAGLGFGGFMESVTEEELRSVLEVNFFSAWALTRACLPSMREAGSGKIIMVSSQSGRRAMPGLGPYAASKFAMEGMSEAWRHELRPFGIWVCLVEPGVYGTDIFGRNLKLGGDFKDPASPYAAMGKRMLGLVKRQAEQRAGDPLDVAKKIVKLMDHPRPPLRTQMGPGVRTQRLLLGILPFSFVERAMARMLRP